MDRDGEIGVCTMGKRGKDRDQGKKSILIGICRGVGQGKKREGGGRVPRGVISSFLDCRDGSGIDGFV